MLKDGDGISVQIQENKNAAPSKKKAASTKKAESTKKAASTKKSQPKSKASANRAETNNLNNNLPGFLPKPTRKVSSSEDDSSDSDTNTRPKQPSIFDRMAEPSFFDRPNRPSIFDKPIKG